MTVRIESIDTQKINRELQACTSKVVAPKGEFVISETIHVPPGKRLEAHPDGTTLLLIFRGPAIHVHEPFVTNPVTGFHVGECREGFALREASLLNPY